MLPNIHVNHNPAVYSHNNLAAEHPWVVPVY
uniref:Uncharacterized protein n=1 Tax=Anguilla anguilla TaxID=7936 RepID=A0A0E9SY09_ANGAN